MKAASHALGIFGATGTVGGAGIEVARATGTDIDVLAGNRNVARMLELHEQCAPKLIVMADSDAADELRDSIGASAKTSVQTGKQAMCEAAQDCAIMLAASSGTDGLSAIMAALDAGRRVLLANKEALVLAGEHVMAAAREGCGEIIPVDSEHNALAELLLLTASRRRSLTRVWLTASGGPFLSKDTDLSAVTPETAIKHPIWSMGAKISVDSATMMNKGLEVIEACRLFGLATEQVEVVVHPQSIVHAIVEFADGGCLAQCAPADMRATLARGLAWPEIPAVSFGRISWQNLGKLEFLPPDWERFPCLRLAYEAMSAGGSAPAVLNAANEIAVESFLNRELDFAGIPSVVAQTIEAKSGSADTLGELVQADAAARAFATQVAGASAS